ncbi:hypothetical protein JG688_00013927 [Phytophthora aleatoria]|uniref:Uncharacterized protein n=1 Tax=Phytophthora aleatoria TaxID=2496075 RepID=A0A8J5MDQ0_9STRA|nr:hypothetical protein JG688_00013927 [Phytophthora aleatoria]
MPAKREAGPMELLAFSPSDDGENTDVLEYEDADSELADEDMRCKWANFVPTTSAYTLAHVYEEA